MNTKSIGLGTQLRHAIALLDGDVQKVYDERIPGYRPRYTPIMRVLSNQSPATIQHICAATGLTQSAVSQTVAIMLREDWLQRVKTEDARQSAVCLTNKSLQNLELLKALWLSTKAAADQLEQELSFPISSLLAELAEKLEQYPFLARIQEQSK